MTRSDVLSIESQVLKKLWHRWFFDVKTPKNQRCHNFLRTYDKDNKSKKPVFKILNHKLLILSYWERLCGSFTCCVYVASQVEYVNPTPPPPNS